MLWCSYSQPTWLVSPCLIGAGNFPLFLWLVAISTKRFSSSKSCAEDGGCITHSYSSLKGTQDIHHFIRSCPGFYGRDHHAFLEISPGFSKCGILSHLILSPQTPNIVGVCLRFLIDSQTYWITVKACICYWKIFFIFWLPHGIWSSQARNQIPATARATWDP